MSFQYSEEDVLDAKNLVLAVQEADGSWVVRPFTLDEAMQTISVKIFNEAQSQTGVSTKTGPNRKTKILRLKSTWIEPKNPHVTVGKTVELTAYGLFSDYPCDVPGLSDQVFCSAIGLLIDPHEMVRPVLREVKKLPNNLKGWERDWTVELKIGGSVVVGTIAKHSNFGAVYTAPDKPPSTNPVAVRFTSVKVSGNDRYAAIPIPTY